MPTTTYEKLKALPVGGTDPRRLRSFVVDALTERGAVSIVPGNLGTVLARLHGRSVAVTMTERPPVFHVLVVVDGVTRASVASADDTIGSIAVALDDALSSAVTTARNPD